MAMTKDTDLPWHRNEKLHVSLTIRNTITLRLVGVSFRTKAFFLVFNSFPSLLLSLLLDLHQINSRKSQYHQREEVSSKALKLRRQGPQGQEFQGFLAPVYGHPYRR